MGESAQEPGQSGVPELKGDARRAVEHRGSHLQIIASAGAGKTEVVSQRVVDLFADGVPPRAIVAFTFTERAAEALKGRVEKRVRARLGDTFVDGLNSFFCGTIHSYCFRVLQEHVPQYETYDVLDDHRFAAFLARECTRLGLKDLSGTQWRSIRAFATNVQVVENELIGIDQLEDPFREIYERYLSSLEAYRLLTYGQIISRTVSELGSPATYERVHGPLRHLIVDEYQDVNPAQEELVRLLAQPPVELCVVGDDDQSIYQWRGSTVANIVTFRDRYPNVSSFEIKENRRSLPGIIDVGNAFGATIDGRLPKVMEKVREGKGDEVVCWSAPTEADQAERIAQAIKRAVKEKGYRYRDVAVLVRGSVSYQCLVDAFLSTGVPIAPAGRTLLFQRPEAQVLGETLAWLVDHDWRPESYGRGTQPQLNDLLGRFSVLFDLAVEDQRKVESFLQGWKEEVVSPTGPADLVGMLYKLIELFGAREWDFEDATAITR
ncbi:MAG: ATP-dependent helicase, partial [bacterium]